MDELDAFGFLDPSECFAGLVSIVLLYFDLVELDVVRQVLPGNGIPACSEGLFVSLSLLSAGVGGASVIAEGSWHLGVLNFWFLLVWVYMCLEVVLYFLCPWSAIL